MYKEKYFELLFHCLSVYRLLPADTQGKWRNDLQQYFEMADIDRRIISEMRNQYGVGLENILLVNCKKNILLCDNFQIGRDKLLIQTSVYFSVLGCLLDFLLDHGSMEQKLEAKRKMDWEYCKDYLLGYTAAKEKDAIDLLYEKISAGMNQIAICNDERFVYIIGLIKLALISELAVIDTDNKPIHMEAVLGKSVLFVKIAAEILLSKKEVIGKEDRELVEDIGYIYALIDDLCDFYEDVKTGQMNLLMEYISNDDIERNMETVVKSAVHELAERLRKAEKHCSRQLYDFILQEVREWPLSNMELRKRIWCING